MSGRWRLIVLGILLAGPVLFLAGYGAYQLWLSNWWAWLWWPLAACFTMAYLLAWRWQKQRRLLRVDFVTSSHWTPRDQQAWQLVIKRAEAGSQLTAEQLSNVNHYVTTAQELALELARFYNPKAADPLSSLTIPEILAVIELAAHDLAELIDRFLPAGHLLTVDNWRQAKQATDWYRTASDLSWLISALFSPINTSVRYLASQVGMAQPWQKVQQHFLLWFYTAYVQRMGTYLIEVNSGRLRIGATRYRQLREQTQTGGEAAADAEVKAESVPKVTLALLGQAKVGKSSVINALLGEQQAAVDVVQPTADCTSYALQPPDIGSRLELLDTVGYGHEGPGVDQLRATEAAARQADLLLLVLHARNPARQADEGVLQGLRAFFTAHPDLKMPPVLGVLTHIDLLSPALEWAPPYDWQQPYRPKEQEIDQAVAAVREQLGSYVAGVVPVCTAAGKIYGVQEWLLPAITELLGEARAVALLRCLRAEADAGKVRKLLAQLLAASKEAAKILLTRPR